MATYVCPPRRLPAEHVPGLRWWGAARQAIEEAASRLHKPADLRELSRLAPDERPLVATCDLLDATVVATDGALHRLGAPDGVGEWSRWGWEQISRVEWNDAASRLTLVGQPPLLPRRVMLTLPTPGPLVAVARERIAWTTQLATLARLPSGGTVRVVVRRQPLTDWMDWFLYPALTVATDSASVQAELDRLLVQLRADTGL